jgi:hypothetical protein
VSGPLGDSSWRDPRVEPARESRVTQVIGPSREQGVDRALGHGCLAGTDHRRSVEGAKSADSNLDLHVGVKHWVSSSRGYETYTRPDSNEVRPGVLSSLTSWLKRSISFVLSASDDARGPQYTRAPHTASSLLTTASIALTKRRSSIMGPCVLLRSGIGTSNASPVVDTA